MIKLYHNEKQSIMAAGLAAMMAFVLVPTTTTAGGETPAATSTARILAEQWGVEIQSVRVSAAGYMIDFRYKVLDSDKAARMTDRKNRPYLIDEASQAKLMVPNVPKIGPLRQTAVKPPVGRVFGIMFANPAHTVKAGSLVTVVVGDCRMEHMVVE